MADRRHRLIAGGLALTLLATFLVATTTQADADPSSGITGQVSVREDGSSVSCPECAVGGSAISADGRYVALATSALLDNGANDDQTNVYLRDRQTPGHTVLITAGANGSSRDPAISADGRYVAFDTTASNLAAMNFPSGDANNGEDSSDVVLCDREGTRPGCVILGNVSSDDSGDRRYSNYFPTISSDGTTLAYQQADLDEDDAVSDVVVSIPLDDDGALAVPAPSAYVDVNPVPNGSQVTLGIPRISADGHHVAFAAAYRPAITAVAVSGARPVRLASVVSTALSAAPPSCGDVVEVADSLDADSVATVVSVDSTGTTLSGIIDSSAPPAISSDGSVVAFGFLGASDCGGTASADVDQVLVVDRDRDGAPVDEFMASADTTGQPSQGGAYQPALSADGRYLAFEAEGPNLDNGPAPNGFTQIMERDLVLDQQRAQSGLPRLPAELASVCAGPTAQCQGDGDSDAPALDADGGVVAFLSDATDLVPGGTSDLNFYARQYEPSVTGAALSFGTIAQGTSAQATITVSQVGFGPVPIGELSIAGPDATDFTIFPAQNCAGTMLYETGQCLVSIRYAPSGPGDRTATLVLAAPIPVNIPLAGGSGPPINGFRATPDPIVFPGQRLALTPSGPQTVTVSDNGPAPFTISQVSLPVGAGLDPGDFIIDADSCLGRTLAPGASCQVIVVDRSLGAGPRQAALAFTDDTGGSPQIVGLSAVATTPTLRLSPPVTPGGRVTIVDGQGFPANYPVTVDIAAEPAAPTLSVVTNGNGGFTIGLPIFDDADVGTWPVRAAASNLAVSATAPLLIVLGTVQPPDFTTRN